MPAGIGYGKKAEAKFGKKKVEEMKKAKMKKGKPDYFSKMKKMRGMK